MNKLLCRNLLVINYHLIAIRIKKKQMKIYTIVIEVNINIFVTFKWIIFYN